VGVGVMVGVGDGVAVGVGVDVAVGIGEGVGDGVGEGTASGAGPALVIVEEIMKGAAKASKHATTTQIARSDLLSPRFNEGSAGLIGLRCYHPFGHPATYDCVNKTYSLHE